MLTTLLAMTLPINPPKIEGEKQALQYLMENIAPKETLPGTVVAGTSKSYPNYWYHWTRDAALVMDTLLLQYQYGDRETKSTLLPLFHDYLCLSAKHQNIKTLSHFGEPKFQVNGLAFNEPWGRPQNDGPALCALTLIRIASQLYKDGKASSAEEYYKTVIKPALNYTVANWKEPSFDLWEEVFGEHFYTKMVQRKALLEGATLADSLGDRASAKKYRSEASSLECSILAHIQKDWIVPTLNRTAGLDWKSEDLDSSIILALLHTQDEEFIPITNDYAINTAFKIVNRFKQIYPINHNTQGGIAIGRYPEDRYNGIDFDEGNPWFLLTFAFSEYYALLAKTYEKAHEIRITKTSLPFFHELYPPLTTPQIISDSDQAFQSIINNLNALSSNYYERARGHATCEGRMSEQFDKKTGQGRGAENLTWSYANQLRAFWALQQLNQTLEVKSHPLA